jgi:hypothetical protein
MALLSSKMGVKLDLNIQPQPNDETCGPTCLHAVYRYLGHKISLEKVIAGVPRLPGGGTLAVLLGCHALGLGYRARIYSYNLNVFDPAWFSLPLSEIAVKLSTERHFKPDGRLRVSIDAYLQFIELGGELRFEDLNSALIRKYLNRSLPILTGLSATYLYRSNREFGPKSDYDDIRGLPSGHFVVLSGYDRENRMVRISDPLLPNPVSNTHQYEVRTDRLICAILLGIVTHDADLLIVRPR